MHVNIQSLSMLRLAPTMPCTQLITDLAFIIDSYIVNKFRPTITISDLPSSDPLRVPSLMVDRITNSAVEYQVQRNDNITNALIAGYEVIRFGVPMIGEYVNAGRGRRVTFSPAVPGAQFRITAWALTGKGRRSARPTVEYVTIRETSECGMRN